VAVVDVDRHGHPADRVTVAPHISVASPPRLQILPDFAPDSLFSRVKGNVGVETY
jgi:hypothetical protein